MLPRHRREKVKEFFCKCCDVILVISMELRTHPIASSGLHTDHGESSSKPKTAVSSSTELPWRGKPLLSWKELTEAQDHGMSVLLKHGCQMPK